MQSEWELISPAALTTQLTHLSAVVLSWSSTGPYKICFLGGDPTIFRHLQFSINSVPWDL